MYTADCTCWHVCSGLLSAESTQLIEPTDMPAEKLMQVALQNVRDGTVVQLPVLGDNYILDGRHFSSEVGQHVLCFVNVHP